MRLRSFFTHYFNKYIGKYYVNSFINSDPVQKQAIVNTYINTKDINVSDLDPQVCNFLINKHLAHEYNLLGSGYVNVGYATQAFGVLGTKYDKRVSFLRDNLDSVLLRKHQKKAYRILEVIDAEYSFIDWQKDHKSGYRWSVHQWYLDCLKTIGKHSGVDIKVPWELSRMQHLLQLAALSIKIPSMKKSAIALFKNQVLDFIAFNPVNYGVNWSCTMDVGIRCINWLMAFDIYKQQDTKTILDTSFINRFEQSVSEHADFIFHNLENISRTNNHYLANVVSLIIIASYLDDNPLTNNYLVFGYKELLKEFDKQFLEDGSNFECSTSYHCLSGQVICLATSYLLGLPKNKLTTLGVRISTDLFSKEYISKFCKMLGFSIDITNPNKHVPQIGDNDSGRFVKLTPVGALMTSSTALKKYANLFSFTGDYFDEDFLDHRAFISMGLSCLESIYPSYERCLLEYSVAKSISKENKLKAPMKDVDSKNVCASNVATLNKYIVSKELEQKIQIDPKKLVLINYPCFGLCIIKSPEFQLSLYFGNNTIKKNLGHAHQDCLSFELFANGADIFLDPGTYLYTSDKKYRNLFRSKSAHNVIIPKRDYSLEESNDVFSTIVMPTTRLIKFTSSVIIAEAHYENYVHKRSFFIGTNKIKILDECTEDFSYNFVYLCCYSNGYGNLSCSKI